MKLQMKCLYAVTVAVAPRAGAWVETRIPPIGSGNRLSHPVRVRGLKLPGVLLK